MSGNRIFPCHLALVIACGPCAFACGGQAVDGATGAETAGTGGDRGEGTSGMGAGGSELREAALARAERFVNDYGVPCQHERVTFSDSGEASAYPTRVLQTRGRGGPYTECAAIDDEDERFACWQRLACDFDWWNALDWSQWSPDATVIEVVGPRAERINVALTTFLSFPLPEPDAPRIGFVSFYEHLPPESAPPGCHDCGYYWYLDPTPEGVALVLGPPLAGDLEGNLAETELNLCMTE